MREFRRRTVAPARGALVLAAATAAWAAPCGVCPAGNASGSAGDFPAAALGVQTAPVGNPPATFTALSVVGTTGQDDAREFLVSLGLTSTRGNASRPTPYHDKVVLYAGIEAAPGTGDVWAFNPLVTQLPGSGDYNAQGIELDFNNANAHRGEADAGGGLAPPVSYGLSISGAAPFRSTAAMLIAGGEKMWNRGIVLANDCIVQSSFQDLGDPDKSIDIRGNPKFGVYQSSTSSRNLFAGGTGMGVAPEALDARAALHVGAGGLRVDGPLHAAGRAEGTVALDAGGEATVVAVVPAAAASAEARARLAYGLTAVGAPMPALHVSAEAALGAAAGSIAFRVAGGAPGGRVSWSVALPAEAESE